MSDFIIVGGGIMGLLLSWELTQSQHSVTLIDKQTTGREASWAGGGIVSPLYPWRYSDPITRLAQCANEFYPKLAHTLKEETGIDPEYNPCGLYMLDAKEHESALSWSHRFGDPIKPYSIKQLYQDTPSLASGFQQALHMPHVGNVRNPRLLKSLINALNKKTEFELVESQEVHEIIYNENQCAIGVKTSKQKIFGEEIILCCGAWTPLLSHTLHFTPRIKPIKGEMMIFEPSPGLINNIILYNGRYLIPRKDGKIIIGSTLEEKGYDKEISHQAKIKLLTSAYEIVPELEGRQIEKHWAGLRPGTPGGLPYIGAVPDKKKLWLCAGHFRNGLVLAPGSVRLMKEMLLNLPTHISPSDFDITTDRSEHYI